MSSVILHVEGMDCPSCASKLERALSRVEGIESASVSLMAETATLDYASDEALEKAKDRIKKLGYSVREDAAVVMNSSPDTLSSPAQKDQDSRLQETLTGQQKTGSVISFVKSLLLQKKAQSVLVFTLILSIAYLLGWIWPQWTHYFFISALVIGLFPIIKTVFSSWSSYEFFTIETLLVVAAIGAAMIGEEEEATVVVLLFLLGEFLEGYAANRARASIQSLKKLTPSKAFLLVGENDIREVDAQTLKMNDVIIVRPGDRVPADGIILEGDSTLNEASLTGESVPHHRTAGEEVFAGTINLEGTLRVRVTSNASDNMIARVVRLVEQAQEAKAPTQRFIDRFAFYYTPFVFLLGLLVAVVPPLFWNADWLDWIYKGLAILLIGCPCALVISTPAAIVSALARGARSGLLIKGGEVLERVGAITKAAFDKTGTLTEGRAYVTDIIPIQSSREEILALSAGLEVTSSHPLAEAIRMAAAKENTFGTIINNVKVVVGKGVSGDVEGKALFFGAPKMAESITSFDKNIQASINTLRSEGKSVSVLIRDKDILGLVALRDEPRADAKQGLQELKSLDIQPLMVTGDSQQTADAIGRLLGIEEVHAELLPEDKLNIIKKLQSEKAVVAKIGDGINDAPGLATADVGIAMGQATDVALETADAAILSGNVADVARLVRLSRRTMAVIYQNIVIALGLKGVFLVTTLLGITGLWPAILADTGATVLVTINSMKILKK